VVVRGNIPLKSVPHPNSGPARPASILRTAAALSLAVAFLWSFPRFWYSKTDTLQAYFWLSERNQISNWRYQELPVSQAAEAVLAADKIVSGEFENGGPSVVRVFSAKRYSEQESQFDMFSHTPDRCWTSVGWKLEPATPEFVELTLQGIPLKLERRIFSIASHRELVYFGALVGGQPLPYRLDPHLSLGIKRGEKSPAGIFGKLQNAIDARFLSWPWKSFVNRRPLNGPKQFIRISTPVFQDNAKDADRLLTGFLPQWLVPVGYRQELGQRRRR
jgi:hypothetical protein